MKFFEGWRETMKKALTVLITCLAVFFFICSSSYAGKREKFGEDSRHKDAKRVTYKTSTKKIKWKMVMPWSKGLLFYDIAVHFTDSVRLASAGRLNIKPFSAGELVPAMQSFDAVSQGVAEVGHDWPGYWKGKNEAFVAFGDVPFGLDPAGYNVWLYERGGIDLLQEIYGKFNLFALPGGQTGQDMGLFSNKRATRMEDFKGLRIRTPGWYMDIMNSLGAAVSPLPGGEVYLALERGVIDATEWVGPALDIKMGFYKVAPYYYSGWHEPGSILELTFNKNSFEKLSFEHQAMIEVATAEMNSNMIYEFHNKNIYALERLQELNVKLLKFPKDINIAGKKALQEVISDFREKSDDFDRVYNSIDKYLSLCKIWSDTSLNHFLDVR